MTERNCLTCINNSGSAFEDPCKKCVCTGTKALYRPKKEKPMKLEIIKGFTPNDFYRAALKDHGLDWKCQDFDNDMAWFIKYAGGLFNVLLDSSAHTEFFEYVNAHKDFRRDLIKYGFIGEVEEEVKEEVFYRLGDRFTEDNIEKYILSQPLPGEVCLISLVNGNRWHEPVHVNSVNRITQRELNVICNREKFTKIN